MKWTANKAVYGFLGVLVTFACAPFANYSVLTETSPTSIPVSQGADDATLGQTPTLASAVTLTATSTPTVQPTITPPPSELFAFIQAPDGPLAQPYVTLIAFQSIPDALIEIKGIINSKEFICRGSPCALPVFTSSTVVFQAVSSSGYTSEEISATVRVELDSDGYYVFLDTVSQFAAFSDSCLRFWKIQDYSNPEWAEFVQFPYLLNTDKTLHHLATQLIIHGLVDVDGCPAGGLNVGLDWPTGCGLERATRKMIEWQNQYDEYIWLASSEIGIPPKILKTLIEVESQFWPGNERFYLDEFGLGQVNQLGVDVLLRRDPTLYQKVCSTVLDDCEIPYSLMPAQNQALIRGALVSSQSSLCPTCPHGLDLNLAKQSISFVARVLQANCETVKIIVDAHQSEELEDDPEDPYSDFWKFTLLSYHSGISCFEKAVIATTKSNVPLEWENLSQNLDCRGGEGYVDGVWGNLLRFDTYQYTPADQEIAHVEPVFAATQTPFPTPVPSAAQLIVRVFLDDNQNNIAEESEWMNSVPVLLQAENGMELTGSTVNGQIVFELAEFPIGSDVIVSLPGLYRSETIEVPEQGLIPVVFVFAQPTLPTAIP